MKANTLLNNALKMLGYTDSDGNTELTQRIRNKSVVTVNLVYSELWRIFNTGEFTPIKSLSEDIELPEKALSEAFLYGLAMHIARSENDGDPQQYFAYLYNAKRAGLAQYDKVRNVIPSPER